MLTSVDILGLAQGQSIGANDNLIHDAARLGAGDEIEKILSAAPLERDIANSQGSQPIHVAAFNSDFVLNLPLLEVPLSWSIMRT